MFYLLGGGSVVVCCSAIFTLIKFGFEGFLLLG